MTSFIELHARSGFSFLEGASVPEEMAGVCAEYGMAAMALVDRNGVYGAPRFHMAAKKANIRAHIGSEITCTNGLSYPLLAETREGYRNLCRLITRMKLRAPKGEGAATPEELAEFARGLICITRHPDAWLLDAFGRGNLYAELQRHFNREEEARNHQIAERARRLSIPLVATNGPAYATPAQRELLDVFTCVRNKTTLAAAGRLLERNSERHVKTPAEMERLFADLPEAIAATVEISSRLQFTLADLGYEFPRYPTPEGETQMSFLRKRVDEGARRRYRPYYERAERQIERELALIEKLKLPGYFLCVWDIVRFCKENGILAQGRGSAANSAVCYSLEITAVDPVGMDLLFERFLSEERGEWPDIDIDLPSGAQRERAIQYVYQRYGQLGAAMTANVITYRDRSAAREMAKAVGFAPDQVDALAKHLGRYSFGEYRDGQRDLSAEMAAAVEAVDSVDDAEIAVAEAASAAARAERELDRQAELLGAVDATAPDDSVALRLALMNETLDLEAAEREAGELGAAGWSPTEPNRELIPERIPELDDDSFEAAEAVASTALRRAPRQHVESRPTYIVGDDLDEEEEDENDDDDDKNDEKIKEEEGIE